MSLPMEENMTGTQGATRDADHFKKFSRRTDTEFLSLS